MVVADMPSLEVENDRARSTCCKTCSKEQLHTATAGFFMSNTGRGVIYQRIRDGLFVWAKSRRTIKL